MPLIALSAGASHPVSASKSGRNGMRILMAVPKYPFPVAGGLERQSHELARALVQRGHAVHAVSTRFDPVQKTSDVLDGVRLHRVRWFDSRPARFLVLPFSLARKLLGVRSHVDVVHVHNVSWFGAFVTLMAKALGLPVLTKLPGIGESGIPGMRQGPLGALRLAVLKRSDAIIAMTPDSVSELDEIGYPLQRILKVTNGISLLPAPSPESRSQMVTAIYIGRLSSEKNVGDLLQAWRSVQERATRRTRLRMIGDGSQANELQLLAAKLELGEAVEFSGYRENVQAELAKADLFVLASHAEGNSNAILEAMSAGLPIVATRVGGAQMQIGSAGEHFLVPPGDCEALADRMLELIENEPLRVYLGAAMRDRIATMFSIDRIAAIYEQAYELVLSGRREQVGQLNSRLFSPNETADNPCAA
jgi:glycosyltransferase involved in cell wall biosynthesis